MSFTKFQSSLNVDVVYIQGNIVGCDDKFAVVLGCLQVSDIIGKDVANFIPSLTICDGEVAVPQVCFCELLII